MRGTISAGMALALDELGLVSAFDAVYGASAGAITGAWLLSRPLAGSPAVSRLATDGRLLRAAFEAGRDATHAAFAPSAS
jgi:predicted acylesterase/phospholipase RssA